MAAAGKGLVVFLTWTLTSFACHFAAKQFLNMSLGMWGKDSAVYGVTLLTFTQIFTCFSLLKLPFLAGFGKETEKADCLFVAVISHVIATMATNYSMTLIHADSTFAIKLMEPITSALMSMLIIGSTLTLSAWFSLPFIVCGAVGFIGNPFTNMTLGYGAWYAVISNVVLAIRNLGIKFLNKEKTFSLRPYKIVGAYYTITIIFGTMIFTSSSSDNALLLSYIYLFLSATFHVVYSYVSTVIVLQYLSVVSHSVANIWKRILVVLLLYSVGTRHASPANVAFLLICVLGLLLYVYGQTSSKVSGDKDFGTNNRKKLSWALVVAVVCIVLSNESVSLKNIHFSSFRVLGADKALARSNILARDLLAYEDRGSIGSLQGKPEMNVYREPEVIDFLSWRLVDHPNQTDVLAKRLTTSKEVLAETQRVILQMSTDIFGSYKYAFLMDMANFENKGDPAINMGELHLLRQMNIEVLFNCHAGNCTNKALDIAVNISKKYPVQELVVLCSGGGNMGGYPGNDHLRNKIFLKFPNHKTVIFPQSTWFHDAKHLNFSKVVYSRHKDLSIMLRDRVSYDFVKNNFPAAKAYLVPDAALYSGLQLRFMPPIYDIVWLKRADGESPKYNMPPVPKNLSVIVSDWWGFKTPTGKNVMENTFLFTVTGFMFIQRGRVFITDRLHGHIFGILLDIPHVIIDNKIKKISNFRRCWSAGLEKVRMADGPEDAILKAAELLKLYRDVLPTPVAYMKSLP